MHLITAVLLTACGTANIERASRSQTIPDVPNYTKAQQNEVADELEKCSDCDMISKLLIDFKVMRDQARASLKRIKR